MYYKLNYETFLPLSSPHDEAIAHADPAGEQVDEPIDLIGRLDMGRQGERDVVRRTPPLRRPALMPMALEVADEFVDARGAQRHCDGVPSGILEEKVARNRRRVVAARRLPGHTRTERAYQGELIPRSLDPFEQLIAPRLRFDTRRPLASFS